MAGVQEEHRLRIALLLIGLGACLIVAGFVLGVQHYDLDRTASGYVQSASLPQVTLDRNQQAKLIRQVLFILLILLTILLVSLSAFRVWSRRFRQLLLHKPAAPTVSSDVWAMHQLPEEPPDEAKE
jgi:uncharacterized membrane protein YidH (DUF202 family)